MAVKQYNITNSPEYINIDGVVGTSVANESYSIQKSNINKFVKNILYDSISIIMLDATAYDFRYTEVINPATGVVYVSLNVFETSIEGFANASVQQVSGTVAVSSGSITVTNPEYNHYTAVTTLINETDLVGVKATADAGGSNVTIVDADGAFLASDIAVGYSAFQTDDSLDAIITEITDATTITLAPAIAGTWESKAYSLPQVKRYEIDMTAYNYLTLQYLLWAKTDCTAWMKIYGTLDSNANISSDDHWFDLSLSLLGNLDGIIAVTSPTAASEGLVIIAGPRPMLKYMVKLAIEHETADPSTNYFNVLIKKSS